MHANYCRQNDLPTEVHALIPKTWEYLVAHGKRDFTDAVKVTDLQTGRLSWIIQLNTI